MARVIYAVIPKHTIRINMYAQMAICTLSHQAITIVAPYPIIQANTRVVRVC